MRDKARKSVTSSGLQKGFDLDGDEMKPVFCWKIPYHQRKSMKSEELNGDRT